MRKADNLPPSRDVVTKSGNLNYLEPCGPVQASNRTALTVRTQQEILITLFRKLSVVLVELVPIQPGQETVPIVIYIRLYLLIKGLDTPETCRG